MLVSYFFHVLTPARVVLVLGYEFKVITCVVLGGVSVAGGSGRMSGVVAGTFIIGALNNGMVLMNINTMNSGYRTWYRACTRCWFRLHPEEETG